MANATLSLHFFGLFEANASGVLGILALLIILWWILRR